MFPVVSACVNLGVCESKIFAVLIDSLRIRFIKKVVGLKWRPESNFLKTCDQFEDDCQEKIEHQL